MTRSQELHLDGVSSRLDMIYRTLGELALGRDIRDPRIAWMQDELVRCMRAISTCPGRAIIKRSA